MDHRRKKIIFALPIAACIPAMLILLGYYDIRIPLVLTVGFFGAWFACFSCDAVYTVLNKRMIRYESNVIFFPLYARLGLVAVPVQALVDLGFMALITVVVSGSFFLPRSFFMISTLILILYLMGSFTKILILYKIRIYCNIQSPCCIIPTVVPNKFVWHRCGNFV